MNLRLSAKICSCASSMSSRILAGVLPFLRKDAYLSRDAGVEKTESRDCREKDREATRRQAVALPGFSPGRNLGLKG